MINKTFKGFLQYKIAHPKPNTDQTILKLKALQKSREKSRQKSKDKNIQKRNTSSHSKNFSQKIIQQTQSSFNNTTTVQKQQIKSLNDQIRNLQQKVSILFQQKGRQRSPSMSKRGFNDSGSKQRSFTQKQYLSPYCKELKNQKLRDSFYKTYESSRSIKFEEGSDPQTQLLKIKIQARKLLTNINIQPLQTNFFEKCDSIESVFNTLQNIINIQGTKKIRERQQQQKNNSYNKLKCLQTQIQLCHGQQNKLQNTINQLQKQRKILQERNTILNKRLQQQQTQIYQLKMLYTQCQNKLLKQANEHQNEQEQKLSKIRLEYQKRIYRQINNMQKQQYLHTKLKSIINDQSSKNKELQISKKILMDELEKWEKQYTVLMERYNIERLEKNNLEDQRNIQINTYNQYKALINQGYLNLIHKFNHQINALRTNSSIQTQQIEALKSIIQTYEQKIKEVQSDFLTLNHDYTRDVREWVTIEENYEQTIRDLRSQMHQANQTIAQYSKMLAKTTAKKGNSFLETTEHD